MAVSLVSLEHRAEGRLRRRKYSDEELLDAVRMAAETGVFSSNDYRKYAKENSLPSLLTIQIRFGSWREAQQRAGVATYRHRRNSKSAKLAHAYERAKEDILTRRPFLIPDDAETLGLKKSELRLLANEYDLLLISREKIGRALAEVAELGFPDVNFPKGRYAALLLSRGETLATVGKNLNVTKERVRQIVMKYYNYCTTGRPRKRYQQREENRSGPLPLCD